MNARPWMPFYIADYLADTGHLTVTEHGAYLLLIFRYWQDGGIGTDEKLIARYSRLTPAQWKDSRDVIVALFEPGWRHKRIDDELAKATDIIGKRRASALQRYSKPDANAVQMQPANAVQMQTESTHTGVPPSPSQKTVVSEELESQHLAGVPKTRAELDLLETLCREAGGLVDSASAGLLGMAPIMGLLRAGYDLELDVLPTIRVVSAKAKRKPGTWDYFVEAIKEASATRRGLEAAGMSPAITPTGKPAGNIFTHLQKEILNGSARDGGDHGRTIEAVRSIPDLRQDRDAGDGGGLPDGDRGLHVARSA